MKQSHLKNGDIVLVTFPFSNLKDVKVRPAVVISRETVNTRENDVTLAFISSVEPEELESYEVLLPLKHIDFKMSGLKKASVFKLHKITTIEKKLVQRRLGVLGKTIRQELAQALSKAVGI